MVSYLKHRESILSEVRWVARYAFDVTLASIAGASVPTVAYLCTYIFSDHATGSSVVIPTLIIGAVCFSIVFSFCFFVATPLAIFIDRHAKLTLLRTLLLALILTFPCVVYLDYLNHQSSGSNSGPPTEPYSLSHLERSLSSAPDAVILIAIPALSSLLAALTLWQLRFKKNEPDSPPNQTLE